MSIKKRLLVTGLAIMFAGSAFAMSKESICLTLGVIGQETFEEVGTGEWHTARKASKMLGDETSERAMTMTHDFFRELAPVAGSDLARDAYITACSQGNIPLRINSVQIASKISITCKKFAIPINVFNRKIKDDPAALRGDLERIRNCVVPIMEKGGS